MIKNNFNGISNLFLYASVRSFSASTIMTHLLGVSATFYLGFNFVLGGGLAEIPVVVLSLIALVFFRSDEAIKHESFNSRIVWALVLLAFALWNCFIVWFHNSEIELYEPYAKLFVGSLVAFSLAYQRVHLAYVRVGLYFAAITLIYLYFFEYSGKGRFSNGMNPNKWSPLLLSYAVVTFLMIFYEKGKVFRTLSLMSYFSFAVMIVIAGSRSTSLLLFVLVIGFLLYKIARSRSLLIFFAFAVTIFAGLIFFKYTNTYLESRLVLFSEEYKNFNNGQFRSSSGYRFVMWKSGLYSIQDNWLVGSGFDLSRSIEGYEPESKGESQAITKIKMVFGSFHNIWIDTLVSQGVLGLGALITFFMVSLSLIRKNGSWLMFGPLVAVGLNGLTESTLYMSILAGHLALAGAIFMNIDDRI